MGWDTLENGSVGEGRGECQKWEGLGPERWKRRRGIWACPQQWPSLAAQTHEALLPHAGKRCDIHVHANI